MNSKYDLIVVGGGVLGTFHAYHAAQKGLRVAVIEKDKQPVSATVRNFGQVVPSGMNTKWQNYGRESLQLYKEIQSKFDISVRNNGSVYLASNEEELTLLEELHAINKGNEYESMLLTKQACLERYDGVKESYVKGGLYFPQEVTVEPRVMIHRLHHYMQEHLGVSFKYQMQVIHCEEQLDGVAITTAGGQVLHATKVVICCGSEFKTLFPSLFEQSDMEVTKLQMMQTVVQPNTYQLRGSILTGLSIRRYEAFYECPSFQAIKARESKDSLEKKWGVHILFKQATDGSIIIGDSHEYADAANKDDLGFDIKQEINAFMIEEAKKIIHLPSYEIRDTWFGVYAQCKNADIFNETIGQNLHIVTGIGGKGMTGSAGYAKENINRLFK
ncbi:TIGR03364 family FAD-dependent oxidoreductase [Myroides odoratus]|uniref:N-methyltryptophan oxidase n=1 Tax=Myroides odoratus TaxID=256 RepID=A0A378RKZ3_MYROD|nr:TIGR03364 family FAD-dependent oxidoreductase [Myroides odoratus]QQU04855.1 TIGR03364 family FAD-dependent oxidoreductase [Myroides odoratus]STZ27686.1 N-methyltryptophan oxidase [Myroides odoratus]